MQEAAPSTDPNPPPAPRRSHHPRREDREVLRAAQPEPHSGHLRHRPEHRARRNPRAARALGLGQIDHAAHVDRPLHAHRPARSTGTSKPIAGAEINVSIVFQSFALFPWLTVLENVEAPLQARGVDARRAPRAQHEDARHGRPRRLRGRLSQGTLRRHEAARRLCPRPGRRAGSALHGRAFLRARRADRREPAQRTAGAVGQQDHAHQGRLPRHAQH